MSSCPCGFDQTYELCCAPILKGEKLAAEAEGLVRARYTAFVMRNLDFVERTHAPEVRDDFNRAEAESLAEQCKWHSLHIHGARVKGDEAEVDYVVRVWANNKVTPRGSVSTFRREDGQWLFVSSKSAQHIAHMRTLNVGRNDPCICNSGKKFKKCCANKPEYAGL